MIGCCYFVLPSGIILHLLSMHVNLLDVFLYKKYSFKVLFDMYCISVGCFMWLTILCCTMLSCSIPDAT